MYMYIYIIYIITTILFVGLFCYVNYQLGEFFSLFFTFKKAGIRLPVNKILLFLFFIEFMYFITIIMLFSIYFETLGISP